jgi:hypothetical protein
MVVAALGLLALALVEGLVAELASTGPVDGFTALSYPNVVAAHRSATAAGLIALIMAACWRLALAESTAPTGSKVVDSSITVLVVSALVAVIGSHASWFGEERLLVFQRPLAWAIGMSAVVMLAVLAVALLRAERRSPVSVLALLGLSMTGGCGIPALLRLEHPAIDDHWESISVAAVVEIGRQMIASAMLLHAVAHGGLTSFVTAHRIARSMISAALGISMLTLVSSPVGFVVALMVNLVAFGALAGIAARAQSPSWLARWSVLVATAAIATSTALELCSWLGIRGVEPIFTRHLAGIAWYGLPVLAVLANGLGPGCPSSPR